MSGVLIIGARRHRQGIGEFVARAFTDCGASVTAIVGTSDGTVAEALRGLRVRHGLACRGYTSLERALAEEEPDIVAVCSPIEHHREHLEQVAEAGAHCLCEKPLWWGESLDRGAETARLLEAFSSRGRYLGLLTQWPVTLESFYTLYPEERGRRVERFEMWMGPASPGSQIVLDSVSHPLSMLERLVGPGEVEDPVAEFAAEGRRLDLTFDYRAPGGATEVVLGFEVTERPPRPAGYTINDCRVERRLVLPTYDWQFVASGAERTDSVVGVEDPLRGLVRDFLEAITIRRQVDRESLMSGMRALEGLLEAAEEGERELAGGLLSALPEA